jgi:hypothetical protein
MNETPPHTHTRVAVYVYFRILVVTAIRSMTIYFLKWPRLNLCHMITHLFLRTATGTHPWHLFNPSIKINNQFQLYLWYIYINILYQQYQLNIIILLQCTVFLLNNAPFAEEKGKHAAAKFFNVDRKRVCFPGQLLLISDA